MSEDLKKDKIFGKKKLVVIIATVVLVLVVAVIFFINFRSQITATTMRLLRVEGTVSLEEKGKTRTVKENLRLNDGNALSTESESLVSIGLDETKVVTLDEKSRAEFSQKGRKLNLNLTDGSLFFVVEKPLEADESFDIRTSTMVVGIRGTSGWVSVEGENESLIITDGIVHVKGTNPVTGESKEIDVSAGQKISIYLYNDRDVDSIMFHLENVTERDLPKFVLDRLREDPDLLDLVIEQTGWDRPWIVGDIKPTPTTEPKEDDDKSKEAAQPTPKSAPEPTVIPKKQQETELSVEATSAEGTPTPEAQPVESSGDSDDEEEVTTGATTPTQATIQYNTATRIGPNGGQFVQLEGGGTAEFFESGANPLRITGADANGHVKIPATITDMNGQQQGPFDSSYMDIDDVNIRTIDATAFEANSYASASTLLRTIDEATYNGKNSTLERVYNSTTSIDTTTGVATVTPDVNDDMSARNVQELLNSMEYSSTVSRVDFGSTQVTHTGTTNGTFTVVDTSDPTKNFTFTGNSTLIYVDSTSKQIVFDYTSNPPAGVINFDGTIQ